MTPQFHTLIKIRKIRLFSSVKVPEEKPVSPTPPAPRGPCKLCPMGFDLLK